jgi:hypothetical protein
MSKFLTTGAPVINVELGNKPPIITCLYHVINLALNNPPSYTILVKLNNSSNRFQHNITIEEVCNGAVHPILKETIIK